MLKLVNVEQGSLSVQDPKGINVKALDSCFFICRNFKNVSMLECEKRKQMIVAGVFLPIKISRFVNLSSRSSRSARILACVSCAHAAIIYFSLVVDIDKIFKQIYICSQEINEGKQIRNGAESGGYIYLTCQDFIWI